MSRTPSDMGDGSVAHSGAMASSYRIASQLPATVGVYRPVHGPPASTAGASRARQFRSDVRPPDTPAADRSPPAGRRPGSGLLASATVMISVSASSSPLPKRIDR